MNISSGRPDLVLGGVYNDCVCDDVVRGTVVLEEEDGEADGEEEGQREVLDGRPDESTETHTFIDIFSVKKYVSNVSGIVMIL